MASVSGTETPLRVTTMLYMFRDSGWNLLTRMVDETLVSVTAMLCSVGSVRPAAVSSSILRVKVGLGFTGGAITTGTMEAGGTVGGADGLDAPRLMVVGDGLVTEAGVVSSDWLEAINEIAMKMGATARSANFVKGFIGL